MTVGWGFVSTGRHPDTRVAPAMTQASGARLVACYSRDMGRAEEFAARHQLQSTYDSLDSLLADSRVDAVFVASPNYLHHYHTIMAAQAGKHVLVEKPMATRDSDAAAMVTASRRHGVTLGVAYQLRNHPGHQEAR